MPVIKDVPFAKELSFNVAARFSDYDSFGNTTNGKFGLTWRPIDDLLLRGNYAQGFRAPTISDLYSGLNASFDYYADPCDTHFGAAGVSPEVLARCRGGVATQPGTPENFRQPRQGGGNCASMPCQTPMQFFRSSNDQLQPETATTKTVGVVYSPSWISGLDLSLDWYRIKIKDAISLDDASTMLDDCYLRGIESRCAGPTTFTRDPVTGDVVALSFGGRNAGYQETEGFDFDLTYTMETDWGRFGLSWLNTYVSKNELKQDNLDTPPLQLNGTTNFGANFRLRSNASLNWDKGPWGATWGVRYYSGLREDCFFDERCSLPDFTAPEFQGETVPMNEVGSNTFHDVQVRWNAPWNATVAIGANNVFEHYSAPMYSQPNSGYSYYGGFDIGRFVYLKYQQRF